MFSGAAKGMVIIYRKWIGMHGWDNYCYFRDGKMTGSFKLAFFGHRNSENGGHFLNEK